MPSNDGDHHIEGDEGDDQPADDQAGLVKGSLQALMPSLLPLPLKVHQVVCVILLLSINFCSGLLVLPDVVTKPFQLGQLLINLCHLSQSPAIVNVQQLYTTQI